MGESRGAEESRSLRTEGQLRVLTSAAWWVDDCSVIFGGGRWGKGEEDAVGVAECEELTVMFIYSITC